jgi:hypothetical protein
MSKPIDHARTEGCTREAFEKWFNVYRHALRTHGDALCNIYNMDETGFQMGNGAKSYVVIDKRLGTSGYVNEASKTKNITVIECSCMDGSVIPPFTIFKGKNLQSTWFPELAPDNWVAVTSESGWSNNALALIWLKQVFEPNTTRKANGRPRILILDGHGSHLTPEFLDYCDEHRIVILCLPPHTSHILQPMDRMFPAYKHWFRREVDRRLRLSQIKVTKTQFLDILRISRPRGFTAENVESGFRKTGLLPFNPALALRQLPLLPPTPPRPTIPLEQQTPHNLAVLRHCISMVDTSDEGNVEASKMVRAKINKAATTAMAKIEILERELQETRAFQSKQGANKPRKKRRALGGQALTCGDARAKTRALEGGTTRATLTTTTRTTRSRKRPASPDGLNETWEGLSDEELSDISSCIICEPR